MTWILAYEMSPPSQEPYPYINYVVKIQEKFGNSVYELFAYRKTSGGNEQAS